MASEEPAAGLYDFVYRDSARVASYYAQLFNGRLTSVEESDSSKSASTTTGKVNFQLVAGDRAAAEEVTTSIKRVTDPHDVATIDVLHHLIGLAKRDPLAARHNDILLVQGSITFVDRSLLELGMQYFDNQVIAEKAKPARHRDRDGILQLEAISKLVRTLVMPSSFVLQTTDGVEVGGTVKDAGMEEPIVTYYFRHGIGGLSEVYLIGIVENSGPPAIETEGVTPPLLSAGRATAEAMKNFVFPHSAIRVTPLAMFRQLA